MKRLNIMVMLCMSLAWTGIAVAAEDSEKKVVVRTLGDGQVWVSTDGSTFEGETVDGEPKVMIFRSAEGDGEGQTVRVIAHPAAGGATFTTADGKVMAVAMAAGADAGIDGNGQRRVFSVVRRAADDGTPRGWLGVSIGDMPEALADQLGTDGHGVVVLNVAKDSPAEAAGFEVHDVIVAVGGEDVETSLARTVDLIKSRAPGDVVDVVVLRGGREVVLPVVLGTRPNDPAVRLEWKFEGQPQAQFEEQVSTRGRVILRNPEGKWITADLGQISDLEMLPEDVRALIPQSGTRMMNFYTHDEGKTVRVQVTRDGATVAVSRQDEGDIEVTRTDANGTSTTKTYATGEALQQADPEAWELYQQAGQNVILKLDGTGGAGQFHFDLDFDGAEWQENVTLWRENLHESLAEARVAHEEAMQELRAVMEQMRDEQGLPALPDHLFQAHPLPSGGRFAFTMGKPKYTFEVRVDGTIEARLRDGDSEIVQLYAGEDDLARRNPRLYERYERLMHADPE